MGRGTLTAEWPARQCRVRIVVRRTNLAPATQRAAMQVAASSFRPNLASRMATSPIGAYGDPGRDWLAFVGGADFAIPESSAGQIPLWGQDGSRPPYAGPTGPIWGGIPFGTKKVGPEGSLREDCRFAIRAEARTHSPRHLPCRLKTVLTAGVADPVPIQGRPTDENQARCQPFPIGVPPSFVGGADWGRVYRCHVGSRKVQHRIPPKLIPSGDPEGTGVAGASRSGKAKSVPFSLSEA